MFVQCPLPPPAGTNMTLQVRIGSGEEVVVRGARVIWVRDRVNTPMEPSGVGVELGRMEEGSRQRWLEFCRDQGRELNSEASRA